jgi:hypothetical protein
MVVRLPTNCQCVQRPAKVDAIYATTFNQLSFGPASGLVQGKGASAKGTPSTDSTITGRFPITNEAKEVVASILFSSTDREGAQLSVKMHLPDGSEYASFERRSHTSGARGTSGAKTVVLLRGQPYCAITGDWNGYAMESHVSLRRFDGSGGLQASDQDQVWNVVLLLLTFGLYGCGHSMVDSPLNLSIGPLELQADGDGAEQLPPFKFKSGSKTGQLDFAGHSDESKTDLLLLGVFLTAQAFIDVSLDSNTLDFFREDAPATKRHAE